MTRPLATACLLVLVPLAAAQNDKLPNLYPFVKGTKWQYNVIVGENRVEVVTAVTALKTEKGQTTATISATTPDGKEIAEELTADDKGVSRHSISGVKTSKPVTIIKYPVKKGDSWTEKIQINGMDAEVTTVVGETSEVEVPAGKFKATRIEGKIKIAGQEVSTTNWYADGVGIVKQEMMFGGIEATMELKKFIPAKSKD